MAETTTPPPPLHSTQTNFFGRINVAIIGMTYFFSQREELSSSTSCHTVLAFIVPVLLNFLQIKYQGKNDISPFDTHPKSIYISIASLLLYSFAYDVELRFSASHRWETYAFIARRGMVLFGSLALVSLASILFPDSIGPVLYFLYTLFSAGELLRRPLQTLGNWVRRIIMGRVSLLLPSRLTARAFSNTGGAITMPRPRVQV